MKTDLSDLEAFTHVARAGGFREAARGRGVSASALSEAVRRLEMRLGIRLLHRSTRSVVPTEVGSRLIERLMPALNEVSAALDDLNLYRDRPAGTLRLNVPTSAARMTLPAILPGFLAEFPDIRIEVMTDESYVDIVAEGCDAGIRYDERLEQDMIAVPIGPREQRFALGASPAYVAQMGMPEHPRDLLDHRCIRHRFPSGNMPAWEFEREGETVRITPDGPLIVQAGGGIDLGVDAAVAGVGVVALFEQWLKPRFDSGELMPVLEPWWLRFPGPFLYYSGRRLVPTPLRAFIDYVRRS